jgi:hypothetical protein
MVISADNMGGIQNVRISDIHLNGACNSLAARRPSTLRGGCEACGVPALSADGSLYVRMIMPTTGTIEEPMGGLQVLVRGPSVRPDPDSRCRSALRQQSPQHSFSRGIQALASTWRPRNRRCRGCTASDGQVVRDVVWDFGRATATGAAEQCGPSGSSACMGKACTRASWWTCCSHSQRPRCPRREHARRSWSVRRPRSSRTSPSSRCRCPTHWSATACSGPTTASPPRSICRCARCAALRTGAAPPGLCHWERKRGRGTPCFFVACYLVSLRRHTEHPDPSRLAACHVVPGLLRR